MNVTQQLLQEVMIPVEDLVTITEQDDIETALCKLAKNNLSSVPVVREQQVLAFIDILALLAYLVKVSTRPCALEECDMRGGTSTSCKLTSDNMMTLAKRSKTFLRSKVWELLNSCPTTAGVHHLDKLTTTKEAIKFFAENKHIHRVVVVDSEGQLAGVLSQSAIMRSLASNIHDVPLLGKCKVAHLGPNIRENQLKRVSINVPAIDAFILMRELGLSSLAVTEEEEEEDQQQQQVDYPSGTKKQQQQQQQQQTHRVRGGGGMRIVDNLSASDLRGLVFESNLLPLVKPLHEFFEEVRLIRLKKPALLTCTEDMTLRDVVELICKEAVHRVYVTDFNGQVVGIVSLTDILSHIYSLLSSSSSCCCCCCCTNT